MSEKRFSDDEERAIDLPRQVLAPGRMPATAKLFPGALLRKVRDANGVEPGAEAAVARASSSSGAPLPSGVRSQFEGSLGADLSGVRVHTGAESAEAASSVGARAYTVGDDIHFADGQYAPTDPFGIHLLAHEVAHTQQQRGGSPHRQHKLEVSAPGDAAEVEADRAADAMVNGATFAVAAPAAPLARDQAPAGSSANADRDGLRSMIGLAESAGGLDELGEIWGLLDDSVSNPRRDPLDPDTSIIVLRGKQYHLNGFDVATLRDEVQAAYWRVKDAASAPPPVTQTQHVPLKDLEAARKESAQNAERIRAKIKQLVDAKDEAGLKDLDATIAGNSVTPVDPNAANADAPRDVVIDGKPMKLVSADIEALMQDLRKAQLALHPNLDERGAAAGVTIEDVHASFQIAANRLLYKAMDKTGKPELRTDADTTVTIRATHKELSISFNPPIVLHTLAVLAKNVSVSGVKVPFKTGKPVVDADGTGVALTDPSGDLEAALVTKVNAAIGGTKLATPGYDPFEDRDLADTLAKVGANLSASTSGPSAPAQGDEVSSSDISHRALGGTFTTTKALSVGASAGKVQVSAGAHFDVTVHGVDEPNLAAPDVKDITVHGGPMTIVAGDEAVAQIDGVTLARGGAVTVAGLKLLGKLDSVGAIEKLLRLLGIAAQAHDRGASDPMALGLGAQGANDDATRALVKKQLEDAFTQAAQDAIMQNRRAIPGIDLAQAIVLPGSLIVQ